MAAALGLARGASDLTWVALQGNVILSALGMSANVFVFFALAVSVTRPLRRFWMVMATRVTGSWLAATGLILAGWFLRFGSQVQ